MRALCLVLLSGATALAGGAAQAADFSPNGPPIYDAPYVPPPVPPPAPTYNAPYGPPPVYHAPVPPPAYEPPAYRSYYPPPHAEAREECRTYMKPRIDEWGRQVMRRVRVCEETVGAVPHYAPPPYATGPAGVYYAPDYGVPRPPVDIGVEYVR